MLVPENGQNRPSIAGVIQWLSVSLSQIYHWPHLGIANAAVPVARWVDSNVVPELQSLVGLDSHAGFDPISIKVVSTSVNTTIKQTDSKMKLIKNTGDSCTMPDTARSWFKWRFWQRSSTAVLTVHRIRCFTAFSRPKTTLNQTHWSHMFAKPPWSKCPMDHVLSGQDPTRRARVVDPRGPRGQTR